MFFGLLVIGGHKKTRQMAPLSRCGGCCCSNYKAEGPLTQPCHAQSGDYSAADRRQRDRPASRAAATRRGSNQGRNLPLDPARWLPLPVRAARCKRIVGYTVATCQVNDCKLLVAPTTSPSKSRVSLSKLRLRSLSIFRTVRTPTSQKGGDPVMAPSSSYDLIIKNGRHFDGTGAPAVVRHLGIRDGKLVTVSTTPLCREGGGCPEVIDALSRVGDARLPRHAYALRRRVAGQSRPEGKRAPRRHHGDVRLLLHRHGLLGGGGLLGHVHAGGVDSARARAAAAAQDQDLEHPGRLRGAPRKHAAGPEHHRLPRPLRSARVGDGPGPRGESR